MTKLLNREAANNVFSNGPLAHDFMKKGGAAYISTADTTPVNPTYLFHLAKAEANGLPHHSGNMEVVHNAEQMIKNANNELLNGKHISEAGMTQVDGDTARRMVEGAEKQIANNSLAEILTQRNNHTY